MGPGAITNPLRALAPPARSLRDGMQADVDMARRCVAQSSSPSSNPLRVSALSTLPILRLLAQQSIVDASTVPALASSKATPQRPKCLNWPCLAPANPNTTSSALTPPSPLSLVPTTQELIPRPSTLLDVGLVPRPLLAPLSCQSPCHRK